MTTLADRQTRDAYRSEIVKIAQTQLGYVEGNGNDTKYGRWFGLNGHPWCAMYVSWVYDQAAKSVKCENPLAGLQTSKGFAGVTTGWASMKKRGWALDSTEGLLPGDVVCWDHDSNPGGAGHTGLVIEVTSTGYKTIEGNTNTAFSRTGGMVCEHSHSLTDGKHGVRLGFARPTRKYGR